MAQLANDDPTICWVLRRSRRLLDELGEGAIAAARYKWDAPPSIVSCCPKNLPIHPTPNRLRTHGTIQQIPPSLSLQFVGHDRTDTILRTNFCLSLVTDRCRYTDTHQKTVPAPQSTRQGVMAAFAVLSVTWRRNFAEFGGCALTERGKQRSSRSLSPRSLQRVQLRKPG